MFVTQAAFSPCQQKDKLIELLIERVQCPAAYVGTAPFLPFYSPSVSLVGPNEDGASSASPPAADTANRTRQQSARRPYHSLLSDNHAVFTPTAIPSLNTTAVVVECGVSTLPKISSLWPHSHNILLVNN